jgi:hypothetical protein
MSKSRNEIIFRHPTMNDPLLVKVKPDEITWSYELNTKNYPTYGGEVVQILSMAVGDLTIKGTVGTYAEMEYIYSWFINYMQNATQGRGRANSYDTRPVTMEYVYRQWKFSIYPTSLPGFRYGKDVVAPTWTLTAAVSEYSDTFKDAILNDQQFAGEAKADGFEPFGTATGDVGYKTENKWSSVVGKDDKAVKAQQTKDTQDVVDYFTKLIPSYLDGDFSTQQPNYSQPATAKASGGQSKPSNK